DLHVGQPTVLSPTAAGGTKPYAFKQGSTPLPKGLSLNAATGEISGTPEVAVDGLYPIVISDQSGQSLTAPLRLVVAAHTLTVSYPDHAGHVGTPFTVAPSVSHALGTVTYALSKGTLPTGMTFNTANGEIAGTPTAPTPGPVAMEVTATDSYASTTASFTVTVDSGTAALSVSYPNATGHVGKAQSIRPTISGASGATTFTVTAGTLPLGVNLDPSTGVISGTPAAAQGAQPITVRVTDSATSVNVTFTIAELAHTLSVAYPSSTGDVGAATTITPVVSHTIGTVTYALTSGTLPAGLALDPITGVITGTPTQVTSGAVPLTVTATDGYGSASSAFTITVTAVTPPVATIDATLSRDVDRMTAVGSVVGAPAGTTITPWYRLPGDTGYTAGVPVTLDANGGFTWTRKVNRSKTARVYFTVSGVQSTTLVGQAPKVEVTGSRTGTSLLVTATTVNIAPGSTVKPYIKIDGGKAIRGTQLQVAADGTFAWTYIAQKGQQIRVKFNVRGVKSDPIVL
ncbi:MAG: putative Ig domain-containing protein, partial [Ilumatobacteraceae bacterium]